MEKERPHFCNVCGKRFRQMNQLRQHKIIHEPEEERPFTCYVCGKKFNRLHHLNLHVNVHMGQSPHTCEVCGQTCNQQSDLKKHLMIHTGEKPHSCPVCGKGFIQIGGMKRHLEKHNEEKISLACEVCGKEFARASYLKKHVLCHSNERPFICDICYKSFSRESALKQHIIVHNEEEPYKCEQCGKTFKRAGNLEKHYATHSSSLPYQCTICGKDFLQLASYKKHMAFHGIILSLPEENPECDSVISDFEIKTESDESLTGGEIIMKMPENLNLSTQDRTDTNENDLVDSISSVVHDYPSINRAVAYESKDADACLKVPEDAQDDETTDSVDSQIDDCSASEFASNMRKFVLGECSLEDEAFNDDNEDRYIIVVEKLVKEDLQELVDSVS